MENLPPGRRAINCILYKVYTIKSEIKNYIYVGITNNLERRILQHNNGYAKSTKAFRPFKLFYEEVCENRIVARSREQYLKSGVGKEYLKGLLK